MLLAQLDWLLSIFLSSPAWRERGWPAEGAGRGQLTTPFQVNKRGWAVRTRACPEGHWLRLLVTSSVLHPIQLFSCRALVGRPSADETLDGNSVVSPPLPHYGGTWLDSFPSFTASLLQHLGLNLLCVAWSPRTSASKRQGVKLQSKTSEVSAGNVLIWMVSACLGDPQGSRPPVPTVAVKTKVTKCPHTKPVLSASAEWLEEKGRRNSKEIKLQGQECRLLPGTPRWGLFQQDKMPSRYLGDTDPFSSLLQMPSEVLLLFNTFSHSMSMFEAAPTAACGRAAGAQPATSDDKTRARLQPCDQCCTEEETTGAEEDGAQAATEVSLRGERAQASRPVRCFPRASPLRGWSGGLGRGRQTGSQDTLHSTGTCRHPGLPFSAPRSLLLT